MAEVSLVNLPLYEWMSLDLTDDQSTSVQVMAVRQQAITWANVDPDLCRHMASLGPNGLNQSDCI